MGILDLLFPKYCISCKKLGAYLCTDCFARLSFDTKPRCLVCSLPSLDGKTHPRCQGKYTIDGSFSAIAYNGIAKKLLYVFKYKPFVTALQEYIGEIFYEGLIQLEGFSRILEQHKTILVPIPLHSSKMKSRGYNQAQILADQLSKKFDLPVVLCLERVKKTPSQYGLKKEERKKNIEGAFSVLGWVPEYIFLVDDILTTGSTLQEAAKVLKKAGAENVWGLTFAED